MGTALRWLRRALQYASTRPQPPAIDSGPVADEGQFVVAGVAERQEPAVGLHEPAPV